jgi:hypothetical protein
VELVQQGGCAVSTDAAWRVLERGGFKAGSKGKHVLEFAFLWISLSVIDP